MRILIGSGCLIAMIAIALAGCGSGSSSSSGSTSTSGSSSTASTKSTAGSTEPGKSSKAKGASESEEIPASATPPATPPTKVEIPTGLETHRKVATKDIKKGTGATAKAGDEVTVQYVGVGAKSKKQFDSTWEGAKEPFSFELGAGTVIKGWDEGIEGMKVGGRRELYVPPELGYGSKGTESIAPNEPIVFVIDLLSVKPGS